jgi:beta-lactamase superfamily II metal-dependent hydrolase
MVLCLLSLLFLFALPAFGALGNGKLQIHHIDVGQGNGILVISPQGQTALFDDGTYTNCSNIKSYLQNLGITKVTYHFLSHYHADHLGCIDDLAAIGITIGTAGWDRGYSYSSSQYTNYINTIGSKRRKISKGQIVRLDSLAATPVKIKCIDLNGAGVYSVNGSDENAKSAVFKISYGSFDEVIGGDLTGSTSQGNDVETTVGPETGDVEVYQIHHHGSKYSSNDNWLNATHPEVGVISCGNGNSYGHPTQEALTRLHNHGVHTYWTELGAGASPNPSWDKVGGTIVIQAGPGATDTYTVSGNGFTDSYRNGGLMVASVPILFGVPDAGEDAAGEHTLDAFVGGGRETNAEDADEDEVTGVGGGAHILLSISPMPVRDVADFRIDVARGVAASLRVYSLDGRTVATLRSEGEGVRIVRWDRRTDRGTRAPRGVYFAQLTAGAETVTARLVLLGD